MGPVLRFLLLKFRSDREVELVRGPCVEGGDERGEDGKLESERKVKKVKRSSKVKKMLRGCKSVFSKAAECMRRRSRQRRFVRSEKARAKVTRHKNATEVIVTLPSHCVKPKGYDELQEEVENVEVELIDINLPGESFSRVHLGEKSDFALL